MTAPPSVTNYQIPTGKAYFTDSTGGGEIDLGDVVDFTITNDTTVKDHFRSYGGSRKKDKSIIAQVASTAKFTLDEISVEALQIFALGDVGVANTDGSYSITALTRTNFIGTLRVVGDNDVGPQVDWEGVVSFTPGGDFSLIKSNDDWNTIAISASVQEDDTLGFGVWTIRAEGAGLVTA